MKLDKLKKHHSKVQKKGCGIGMKEGLPSRKVGQQFSNSHDSAWWVSSGRESGSIAIDDDVSFLIVMGRLGIARKN